MDLLRSNQNQSQQDSDTPTQEVPEIKKRLWSITKGIDDGQVRAGEVDRQQEEFLKTTEFIK